MTVITGLSGSGKSTLLFDVLHAEGQRRYVETFSPYVRQFLDNLPRPDVESIENARPSIAVEQKNSVKNSRSTVGTMTELCDYFKVWFSEVASLHDPIDGSVVTPQTTESQTNSIIEEFLSETILVGFQCRKPNSLGFEEFISFLESAGYNRILVGGKYQRLSLLKNSENELNQCFVVIDKIKVNNKNRSRIAAAISNALESGKSFGEIRCEKGNLLESLTLGLRSKKDGKLFESPTPNLFSFNSPQGACPHCRGFGRTISIDKQKVIPNTNLTISQKMLFVHSQERFFDIAKKI